MKIDILCTQLKKQDLNRNLFYLLTLYKHSTLDILYSFVYYVCSMHFFKTYILNIHFFSLHYNILIENYSMIFLNN